MIEISGIYASASVHVAGDTIDAIEPYAAAQLRMLCDNPAADGSKIHVMPDVHPGKVCTIGLTMTVDKKILPNWIGADIGCGVTIAKLRNATDDVRNIAPLGHVVGAEETLKKRFHHNKRMDFRKLDTIIRESIPSGFRIHEKMHPSAEGFVYSDLLCGGHVNIEKAKRSLGTLGGGNHFIEVDRDDEGSLYLVVHSGSRHLGQEVTEHYLRLGAEALKQRTEIIPYELTYLEGKLMGSYIYDLSVVQGYAELNRRIIIREILKCMKWKISEMNSVCHNFISNQDGSLILRKGAISASKGEFVVIPINMRDGMILGTGLGNAEWNSSAPHGSGRIKSREDMRKSHTVSEYKAAMKGIYSSCVGTSTLDEAPFAYRGIDEIAEAIRPTVRTDKIIRPVYSYKAGGEEK